MNGVENMHDISYLKEFLYIDGKEIAFEEERAQIKNIDDKIFILLKIPPRKNLSYDDQHNVYCYSTSGEMIWQIGKRPTSDDAVYTMITINDSNLYANDFLDRKFKVNQDTGEIMNMRIVR